MIRLLQSQWVVALTGCLLYLGTTAALIRPEHFEGAHVSFEASNSTDDDPSWRFRNPEFEQWIQDLKREREALAQREQQLQEFQTRLESERQELLAATQTVYQLQMEFDKGIVRLKEQEVENLKRQTKVIGSMSPEGAAAMLDQMPEDEVVGILFTLKPEAASLILDTLSKMGKTEAKRAAGLAERMRLVLPPSGTSRAAP